MEYKKYYSKYRAINPEQGMAEEPEANESKNEAQGNTPDALSRVDTAKNKAHALLDTVMKGATEAEKTIKKRELDRRVEGKLGGTPQDLIDKKIAEDPKIQALLNNLSTLIS
ncbi:MAG: hypothetical protein ACK4NC_02135 [Candidatus Gracilibacteria bacterium]